MVSLGRYASYAFLSLLLLAVAGCGNSTPASVSPPAPYPVTRDEVISRFVLLNENGEQKASVIDAATGRSPFGAFLKIPPVGPRNECSVTHIARGVIVTNAHCVLNYRFLQPEDFQIFFYSNKTALQVHYPIARFLYVGNVDFDDVAFIQIPPEAAAEWDAFSPQLAKMVKRFAPEEIDNKGTPEEEHPIVASVKLWGFDPIATRPEFEEGYPDRPGMVFSPKKCKMSRTIPWFASIAPDKTRSRLRKYNPNNKQLDGRTHLVIDDCDVSTVFGNSGSFVTSENLDAVLGVFHWNLTKELFSPREAYLGNRRSWIRIWGGDLPGDPAQSVLNIGTAFDSLLQREDIWSILPTELKS
jgi:Na+-transporting methylmalonyl-CoA/oxaloacetate decarboxylase gamma subunit